MQRYGHDNNHMDRNGPHMAHDCNIDKQDCRGNANTSFSDTKGTPTSNPTPLVTALLRRSRGARQLWMASAVWHTNQYRTNTGGNTITYNINTDTCNYGTQRAHTMRNRARIAILKCTSTTHGQHKTRAARACHTSVGARVAYSKHTTDGDGGTAYFAHITPTN